MSRNSGGVYSLPAGNPVVTGTAISVSWANGTLTDIKTELTDSLSRSNKGGMLAQLQLFAGTESVPGLAWSDDTDTGFYYSSTGTIRYVADGVASLEFGSSYLSITGAVPYLLLSETGVTADNGKWALLANGEEFSIRAYTDDLGTVSQPMLVTRTATTVDTITFAGTQINLNCTAVAVNGDLGVSGPTTFNATVTFTGTEPYALWAETDATANNGKWRFVASGENFYLQALTDDLSSGTSPIVVARTGTTIDSITFAGTTIALTGNFAINTDKFTVAAATGNTAIDGTLTVGGVVITPSEGTFTAALRASLGGANIVTGTAKWKKIGNVVTLRLPALTAATTATALYIEALPAAIQATVAQSFAVPGYDNSTRQHLICVVNASDDTIQITPENGSTFTAGSSTKGIVATTISYFTD